MNFEIEITRFFYLNAILKIVFLFNWNGFIEKFQHFEETQGYSEYIYTIVEF